MMDTQRLGPRLYLTTPPIDDPAVFTDTLGVALASADVAAVLLRLDDADERTLIERVATIAPIVQGGGAALVLDGRSELVERARVDGAHLTGVAAFTTALPLLKPRLIAGAGGLTSRDDAMWAGERGADYVMFGEPGHDGGRPSFAAIIERVAWWAELFEVPCVGYAASFEEVAALARAHAEFVAVGDLVFADRRGPAAALAEVTARLMPEGVT